jgi:CrcB protein
MLKAILVVGAGGACGAVARYLIYRLTFHVLGSGFPYATLIVNVLGSLVMGILTESMALAWSVSLELRLLLVVGVLGAFTTFSTFSLDVATLYERGQKFSTMLYVTASLILSVGAFFVGLALTRHMLFPPA